MDSTGNIFYLEVNEKCEFEINSFEDVNFEMLFLERRIMNAKKTEAVLCICIQDQLLHVFSFDTTLLPHEAAG